MSTVKASFAYDHQVGRALAPQSVTSATVNGPAIVEPWKDGRVLVFLLSGGAIGGASQGACVVQGQKRSDDAWEALKEADGTTDLEFEQTDMVDGGALENGVLLGSIDLNRVDAETYKAVRLSFTESGGAAMLVGASYVIDMVLSAPTEQADQLFEKQRAVTA